MKDPLLDVPWLKWAMELQFIGQAGVTYSNDKFDLERFHRIREIAAEILSLQTGLSIEKVTTLFCNETSFQTPKLDCRAAIFEKGRILLVRERDGLWSLPGGWVDVNQSVGENTVKEVKEEAGLDVVPVKLIALQDRSLHNLPYYGYGICKALVQCEVIGGEFVPNTETTESRFFLPDELPALSEDKITATQIHFCFEAYRSENWQTLLD
ncbi:MAG: NUDIX hydrolase [Bacteroides sp.]|nr:NUDIX hydrolase [Bacteroides sp.]